MSMNNTTEESKRILTAFYAAGMRNDWQTLMDFMDDDIVVYEPPYLPYGGTYRGKANFPKIIESLLACGGDLSKITVNYMVAEGERVICNVEILDTKTGKNFMLAEESVVRNGKIVEMRVYYFDAGSLIGQLPRKS